jgi:hypothetical protein
MSIKTIFAIGHSTRAIVLKSVKNPTVEEREKAYYENIAKAAHAIFREIVHCIDNGLDPASDEVQRLIKKHHAFAEQTHTATKEVYMALAKLYQEHPEFRKQLVHCLKSF